MVRSSTTTTTTTESWWKSLCRHRPALHASACFRRFFKVLREERREGERRPKEESAYNHKEASRIQALVLLINLNPATWVYPHYVSTTFISAAHCVVVLCLIVSRVQCICIGTVGWWMVDGGSMIVWFRQVLWKESKKMETITT